MNEQIMSVRKSFRGKRVDMVDTPFSTTIQKINTRDGVIYMSCELPIAVIFKDKKRKNVMTFTTFGDISVQDKLKLRKSMSFKTILQPAWAKPFARVNPIPLPEPVIKASLSVRSNSLVLILFLVLF